MLRLLLCLLALHVLFQVLWNPSFLRRLASGLGQRFCSKRRFHRKTVFFLVLFRSHAVGDKMQLCKPLHFGAAFKADHFIVLNGVLRSKCPGRGQFLYFRQLDFPGLGLLQFTESGKRPAGERLRSRSPSSGSRTPVWMISEAISISFWTLLILPFVHVAWPNAANLRVLPVLSRSYESRA